MPDLKLLLPKNGSKRVCNHIYNILFFNKLQCLIVKEILPYVILSKSKMQIATIDQLLLYVRGKDDIDKSWVIQTLEIGFIFLNK